MEDHSINPEIVRDCELEIKVCHGDEEETKPGKTIDCLMKMAEEGHEKMGKKCQKAVSLTKVQMFLQYVWFQHDECSLYCNGA